MQLVARVRARGLGEVARLVVDRAREEISSGDTLLFLVRDSSSEAPASDELEFRAAAGADDERYARDIGTDSASTFRARLTPGTTCYIVEDRERFLHATWVTTDRSWAREIRAFLVPPAGDAYIYESFTRDDARGRGIYPFALGNILATLSSTGVARAWIAVEEHNTPSRRSINKAGFTFAFALPYRRRWGRLTIDDPRGPEAEIGRTFVQARKTRGK